VANPGKVHWQTMKWILGYPRGTTYVSLVYDKGSSIDFNVIGHVDSNYVGDLDKRRSLIGFHSKCFISWKETLQSTIALSMIEVLYMCNTPVPY
jgi:hypothetical protein